MSVLDALFARFYDRITASVEQKGMAAERRRLLADLHGEVLEIGAGTGHNLKAYPATVTSLTLTEPSPPMAAGLREHVQQTGRAATVVEAPAELLPFDDGSFDAVVTTLVLCSVSDLHAAAREMRRVLRPTGRLVVAEHVAAKDERGARLQRIVQPIQKVIGRNCHLTRDSRAALERAGFDTSAVVDGTMPGAPPALFPVIIGIAQPR